MSNPRSARRSVLRENFLGTIAIMLGQPGGLHRIDLSTAGFFRSFGGLLLMILLDASVLSLIFDARLASLGEMTWSKGGYIVAHILIALLGYGASMLAVYLMCRSTEERLRFPGCVIVHNWAAPIVSLLFMPLAILHTQVASATFRDMLAVLILLAFCVLAIAGIRILRTTLHVDQGKAVMIFAVSVVVSLVINEGLQSGLGF